MGRGTGTCLSKERAGLPVQKRQKVARKNLSGAFLRPKM